jgi:hypothetical protein
MHVLLDRDRDHPITQNSIRIRPANIESEILGGYVQIAGFEFLISFETPPSGGSSDRAVLRASGRWPPSRGPR